MVILPKYKNKKIAIYGMGKTGFSAAKFLIKQKAKVFCWDDNKKIREKMKFYPTKFWLSKYKIDKILVSPGIDIKKSKIKKYLKKYKEKIITDLDLFFEANKNTEIISITGTNGKSTTCKLIEKILKTAKYNVKTVGNIGKPILTVNKNKKKCIYILEASSYQLEYSKLFKSKHAAILNISSDHLERHKNIKNYTKIKSRIFYAQKSSDYSYINSENKYSKIIKKIYKKRKLKSKLVLINKKDYYFLLNKISNKYFTNSANFENLSFAYKITKNLKITDKTIVQAINNFKGLSHRQEIIFLSKKFICINDSKATTFNATLQSLLNYNNIYWIVGGLPKHKDDFDLKKVKNKIIKAYIIGKSPSFFVKKIKGHIPYVISKNLRNAIKNISKDSINSKNSQSSILLSPAAASFDQFSNFETRGLYFKDLIKNKFIKRQNV